MKKGNRYLLMLLGVQWLLVVIIFFITFCQFYYGFNFNYFMFIPFLVVVMYKIWVIRFDYGAKKELDRVNKNFHALGRRGRREYLYSKGIKKHIK